MTCYYYCIISEGVLMIPITAIMTLLLLLRLIR